MTETVVVLGSGYAGTGAVQTLESELSDEAEIVWISDVDHHLGLHESHRCIRNPDVTARRLWERSRHGSRSKAVA